MTFSADLPAASAARAFTKTRLVRIVFHALIAASLRFHTGCIVSVPKGSFFRPACAVCHLPASCGRRQCGGNGPRRASAPCWSALMPKAAAGVILACLSKSSVSARAARVGSSRQATVRFLRERSSGFEDQSSSQRSGFGGPGANCGEMPDFNVRRARWESNRWIFSVNSDLTAHPHGML